jgi:hypothetical protein
LTQEMSLLKRRMERALPTKKKEVKWQTALAPGQLPSLPDGETS